jgi:7-cyano-7-deazaguanine synthase
VTDESALVLFSGGQDSTVCLAWALERFERVETVGFDYGQRHAVELEVRAGLREKLSAMQPQWAQRLGEDHLVRLDALAAISDTALTRETAIELGANGLPTTFVPARNLIFFCFAGALAYRRGAGHIVTGVCETDYSGYPDCRNDTVKAMQAALALFAMAEQIGGKALLELVVEDTHSCYLGDRSRRHAWGYGCGECPACTLRGQGYAKFIARQNAT